MGEFMRSMMLKSVLVLSAFAATNVLADEESYTTYDAIVTDLEKLAEDAPPQIDTGWDDVAMQGGMSFVTSYLTVSPTFQNGAAELEMTSLMTGIEGHVGSNLFSKQVRGELAARMFFPKEIENQTQVNLKELDGRVAFLPRLNSRTLLRMGLGMGVRFIDVEGRYPSSAGTYSQSSGGLASNIFLGFERKVSTAVSVGPDLSYRSSLSSDSIAKTSWDAAIRLNATF
jgi:hypothetical protein